MPPVNCKRNLILTWSANCCITDSLGVRTFAITDTKLHAPVVTLSTENNLQVPKQFDSGL